MDIKICKNCGQVNHSKAFCCSKCYKDLSDSMLVEDAQYGDIEDYSVQTIKYDHDNTISVLYWIGIIFAIAIPVVNLIVLVIISCNTVNKTLKNFCIAALSLMLIMLFIWMFGLLL